MFRYLHSIPPIALVAALCLLWAAPVSAEQSSHEITKTVRTRTELVQALESAQPETRVLIAPGEYQGGLAFRDLRGAEGRPVVIAALDPADPPVFRGGTSGMHLSRPSYVELHDLVFAEATGNGLNIDDGGKADSPAEHLVLRGLRVRDVGPSGNRDGIKLSGVDHFLVDHCIVERWGSGGSAIDMVGCHHGRIDHCEFQHRGDIAANGVQTKGGSSDINIQRCRFENAGGRAVNIGGSTGRDYFRPRSAEFEAKRITVEDCTFIGSMAPIAFVGVDGALVRYNTIYCPSHWVMRILQESQGPEFTPCRNGVVSNNLIAFRSDQVRSIVNVGGGTSPETFQFANNHWFCIDDPARSRPDGLPTVELNGNYGQDPRFLNESQLDLRFSDQSPVRDAGVRLGTVDQSLRD